MDVAGDKMHAPADAKSPPPQDDAKPPEKETSFQVEVKPESDSDAEDDKSDASEGAWETESLYEDALQLVADEQLRDGTVTDVCSLEEAVAFRKHLRTVGKAAFVRDTIGRGSVTAKKLCTAFRIIPPLFLQDAPDEAYYPLLSIGIEREYTRREKLPQYNTIDDAVDLMKSAKNIIVLTGAGISTSLGIPDFRSKDIGLYSKLAHLGLSDPQEVFDIDLFREDPSLFYSIAKDILPEGNKFTPTHAFIRLLQDKEKLLTNFTQNIDNLEANAGVLPENLIQCHGSFATATCIKCSRSVPGQGIFDRIRMGQIPECEACAAELKSQGLKRKRGNNDSGKMARNLSNDSSDDEYAIPTPGVMKPDITFFGEDLPDSFRRRLIEHDRDRVDLVIVIGTSLKVAPVGDVPGILPSNVPQIFINRDPVSHIEFDIDMLGDCDVVVSELCRRAGWEIKHDMITEDEKVVVEPVPGHPSRYEFRAEKSS